MCNIFTQMKLKLIWDFNMDKINLSFIACFTASQCSVKAKIPSSVNTIYSMPYLDPNSVNCNSAKSSKQEKVLLSCATTTATSQLQRLETKGHLSIANWGN